MKEVQSMASTKEPSHGGAVEMSAGKQSSFLRLYGLHKFWYAGFGPEDPGRNTKPCKEIRCTILILFLKAHNINSVSLRALNFC